MINLEEIREKIGSATTVEESKKIAHFLLGYLHALTDEVDPHNSNGSRENLTFRLAFASQRFSE